MRVELLYRQACPHVDAARQALSQAFTKAGVPSRWRERPIDVPSTPVELEHHGSPTILVDGCDVVDGGDPDAATCRVYRDAAGAATGAPPVDAIVDALRRRPVAARGGSGNRSGWRSSLAVAPGIAAALLPKVACPACWPAYAGLLGSVGLGFLLRTAWLFALTSVFLAIALGALAFRAPRRRGYAPFLLGCAGAGVLLVGKFQFEIDAATYVGVVVLVAASLWNSWPRRTVPATCTSCRTVTTHP